MSDLHNESDPNNYLMPALVLGGVVVIALLYILNQYLLPQFDYEQRLDDAATRLMEKSPAHQSLVQAYRDCRTNSWTNSSRPQCINTTREFAQRTGQQESFERVLSDIKNELWTVQRSE